MPGRKLCQRGATARVPLLRGGITVLAFSMRRTGVADGSVSPSPRSLAAAVVSGRLVLASALICCDSTTDAEAYPHALTRAKLNRIGLLRRMRFTTKIRVRTEACGDTSPLPL